MKHLTLAGRLNEMYLRHVQWLNWRKWRIRRFLSRLTGSEVNA